jgi:hypothetical protein
MASVGEWSTFLKGGTSASDKNGGRLPKNRRGKGRNLGKVAHSNFP